MVVHIPTRGHLITMGSMHLVLLGGISNFYSRHRRLRKPDVCLFELGWCTASRVIGRFFSCRFTHIYTHVVKGDVSI